MSFYSTIAPYYDYIFPAHPSQIKFLKEIIGNGTKQVLDIACGNGSYAIAMAKSGYLVTALDNDSGMIESAKAKADLEEVSLALIHCPMENMKNYIQGKFDVAYCIGNSLVHLEDEEKIESFLKDLYKVLQEDGKAIIQIINYDRVLKHGQTKLPDIFHEGVGLKFFRSYEVDGNEKYVDFKTKLHLKDKVEEHSTKLIPLLKDNLVALCNKAGFKVNTCYGDFGKSDFNEDESYHCIVVLEKGVY